MQWLKAIQVPSGGGGGAGAGGAVAAASGGGAAPAADAKKEEKEEEKVSFTTQCILVRRANGGLAGGVGRRHGLRSVRLSSCACRRRESCRRMTRDGRWRVSRKHSLGVKSNKSLESLL